MQKLKSEEIRKAIRSKKVFKLPAILDSTHEDTNTMRELKEQIVKHQLGEIPNRSESIEGTYLVLAATYMSRKEYDNAEKVLRAGLGHISHKQKMWSVLGTVMIAKKDFGLARAAFRKAMKRSEIEGGEHNIRSRIELAGAFYAEGKIGTGIGVLMNFKENRNGRLPKGVAKQPIHPDIRKKIAEGYEALGRTDKALVILEKIEQSDLDLLEAHSKLSSEYQL